MSRSWKDVAAATYDLMIVTCGYEARSTFIHSEFCGTANRLIILDYKSKGIHSYDNNQEILERFPAKSWLDLKGLAVEADFATCIDEATRELESGRSLRVLMDISSCSRSVLAIILTGLASKSKRNVELTCAYAISAYFDPPDGELPSSVSEPVAGDLSGWSSDLTKPPCAIIGLGFEPGRAVGSIDYLEVPEVRLFVPAGPDVRFYDAVMNANRVLLDEPGVMISSYNILDPIDLYQKLESMILGLMPKYRPIIIPLGPKIFALISMLLALRFLPQVCIWRTSAGSGEDIVDRSASGEIAVFEFILRNDAQD